VRRAALIALDQMDQPAFTAQWVMRQLESPDEPLRQTALSILISRPAWAAEVSGLMKEWLADKLDDKQIEPLRTAVAAFAGDAVMQQLVTQSLASEKTPLATRLLLLQAIGEARIEKLPAAWVAELSRAIESPDNALTRAAIQTVRTRNLGDFDARLLSFAHDPNRPTDLRISALSAAAPRLKKLDSGDFDLLVGQLKKGVPPAIRLTASATLGHAPLDDQQLFALLPSLLSAGALDLPNLLPAYQRSTSTDLGQKLIETLMAAPAVSSLLPDAISQTLKKYPPSVQQAAGPLLKRLAIDVEQQQARLNELQPTLAAGDAKRGKTVFFSQQATCSTCHAINNEGGRIGPDLSKIGSIRTGRDLLESIIYPSTSFARCFEPYTIVTRDNQIHSGIIARESAEAIYLLTPAEERIVRSTIVTQQPSRISIMPQGLDAALTGAELADLVAFLQSLR